MRKVPAKRPPQALFFTHSNLKPTPFSLVSSLYLPLLNTTKKMDTTINTSPKPHDQRHHNIHNQSSSPSSTTSPHSNGSSSSSSTPPLTPKPMSARSQDTTITNPYPTTFVQADATTFKQVVQMLTGSSDTKQASKTDPVTLNKSNIHPIKSTSHKKQGFKLYERRNSLKNGLMINTLIPGLTQNTVFSPRKPEILSPSILDFPSLVLSPATPLNEDTVSKGSATPSPLGEEEKAIAEKKFYFHPSPRTTPRDAEPRLLPLFPVTSPRVSGPSS